MFIKTSPILSTTEKISSFGVFNSSNTPFTNLKHSFLEILTSSSINSQIFSKKTATSSEFSSFFLITTQSLSGASPFQFFESFFDMQTISNQILFHNCPSLLEPHKNTMEYQNRQHFHKHLFFLLLQVNLNESCHLCQREQIPKTILGQFAFHDNQSWNTPLPVARHSFSSYKARN